LALTKSYKILPKLSIGHSKNSGEKFSLNSYISWGRIEEKQSPTPMPDDRVGGVTLYKLISILSQHLPSTQPLFSFNPTAKRKLGRQLSYSILFSF